MRWTEYVSGIGDRRGAYWVLVGRLGGNRPLERPRSIWENNIKVYLEEVGWSGMNWKEVMSFRVP
jgi:hypothetical protein